MADGSSSLFHGSYAMRFQADDWPTAPISGALLVSVLFLSVLPSFGVVWHSVLPEHTHVFLRIQRPPAQILPALPLLDAPVVSSDRQGPTDDTGVIHLPNAMGSQIVGIVVSQSASLLLVVPRAVSKAVVIPPLLYQSPSLRQLDPPP